MQSKDLHHNAQEGLDDNIHVQRIFKFLHKNYTKWKFSNMLACSNPKWAWIVYIILEAIKHAW
jgi:hypothetical protein